jgi:hypothetical protein
LGLLIATTVLLLAIVMKMGGAHTPDEPGSEGFFEKCHAVGFTDAQCKFFRYGTRADIEQH